MLELVATKIAVAIGQLIAAAAEAAGADEKELRGLVLDGLKKQGDATDAIADEIEGSLPDASGR